MPLLHSDIAAAQSAPFYLSCSFIVTDRCKPYWNKWYTVLYSYVVAAGRRDLRRGGPGDLKTREGEPADLLEVNHRQAWLSEIDFWIWRPISN